MGDWREGTVSARVAQPSLVSPTSLAGQCCHGGGRCPRKKGETGKHIFELMLYRADSVGQDKSAGKASMSAGGREAPAKLQTRRGTDNGAVHTSSTALHCWVDVFFQASQILCAAVLTAFIQK